MTAHQTAIGSADGVEITVVSRDGQLREYEPDRIRVAIMKCFADDEVAGDAASSSYYQELAQTITEQITIRLKRSARSPRTTESVENIQDQVELHLMRAGEQKAARSYVMFRERKAAERKAREQEAPDEVRIHYVNDAGETVPIDAAALAAEIDALSGDLDGIDGASIIDETLKNVYEGVSESDLRTAVINTTTARIELEPDYSRVSSRLLLMRVAKEVRGALGLDYMSLENGLGELYVNGFQVYLERGAAEELLSEELLEKFDVDQLASALKPQRDMDFRFLGLQTLYDRYLIHSREIRIELPQWLFMRVAMGVSLLEDDPTQAAIEFYDLISARDYMPSTPTLFNSGTRRAQLSSCFLSTIPDDLHGIYGGIQDNAMLSKFAGGIGNDWTQVRSMGSYIKGTNGKSQGVVPFLKVANDTAVAVNQGGKRRGAVCAYLEAWHMDFEEFLELRKNTGDDRRRTHDMHTANWIPDLFMKRVMVEGDWTLFSPSDVPDLHDLYGAAFEDAYCQYEALADEGAIAYRRVPAVKLWQKMLNMVFETGHPWLTFKDPCNIRSPQQHVGVVHCSNLCTEITLNTSESEIAVCNLGSINLHAHVALHDGVASLDEEKLRQTVHTAVRFLDNVIDLNYYTVPQARHSNMLHRPIGLGLMGFQDCLYELGLSYNSSEAVEFADRSMEAISYFAIEASCQLAEDRGAYESFQGSLWSQGKVPLDSIKDLDATRGEEYLTLSDSSTRDWDVLRRRVKDGIRNSNIMAIAPTATISNIAGVSQSIEPTYTYLYTKSNMSGEFTSTNEHLVGALKKLGIWDKAMLHDLKYHDGSIADIERIPAEIKARFPTAFEISPRYIVESAAARQKWIDQSQSLNLYISNPDGKKLDLIYKQCWLYGLKTTYYLRSLSATATEKSTIATGTLNAVDSAAPQPEAAACGLDAESCEACQ